LSNSLSNSFTADQRSPTAPVNPGVYFRIDITAMLVPETDLYSVFEPIHALFTPCPGTEKSGFVRFRIGPFDEKLAIKSLFVCNAPIVITPFSYPLH
jgi:hypothetical protein